MMGKIVQCNSHDMDMIISPKKIPPSPQFLIARPTHFFALGFGTGLTPKMPGTAGTLIGFPLFFLIQPHHYFVQLGVIVVLFVWGIFLCHQTGKSLGVEDHSSIVWDEIVAMMLVLTFTPNAFIWWLIAFLLFRLFDVWKPFPIQQCDARLKGGFGVMFDDFLAAGYTIVCLKILLWMR